METEPLLPPVPAAELVDIIKEAQEEKESRFGYRGKGYMSTDTFKTIGRELLRQRSLKTENMK